MADKIIVTVEEAENLERLHYEYNALLNVEKAFLDEHRLDPDGSAIESPIYKLYHEKTTEALKAYDEAKNDLAEAYGLTGYNWQLNFKTREVTIG